MQGRINVTYTGGCVNFTYSGSHAMHIHHNICTFYWLERPPPKVIYQPNCEREVPLMTKEVLYGIGLPLHVPLDLPHAVWMMPQMGVLSDGMRLVLQARNRYYINQTTAISSLATLIKECLKCIHIFSLQYICLYNNIAMHVPTIGQVSHVVTYFQVGEGV